MADQSDVNHSPQAQPNRDPATAQTPLTAVSDAKSSKQYVSPAYDLRHVPSQSYIAQPLAAPQADVPVGEETIQIAPHPTINRYPWTAVDNPRVPIYKTVTAAKPQTLVQAPVVSAAIPPLVPQLTPPTPPPAPVSIAVPKPLAAPAPLPVKPEPAVAPPSTKPASLPREVQVPPAKSAPIAETRPQLTEPAAPPQSSPKPVKIYSESTQAVWHVFRPNKLLRIGFVMFVLLLIVGAVAFWHASGSPKNLMNLPVIQSIVHTK